ncbi:FAD-binding protein [Candidatus Daviesbacteria bacterium]|nr:FAD-binding protein [Candidatus Daviesbacteria bacterium]
MKEKIKILESVLGEVRIKIDEPLKYHVENKTSGKALIFYVATNLKELKQVLSLSSELKIPFFLIGGGTKMIIPDKGLEGFVIKNRTGSIKISGVKGKVSPKGIGVDEAMIEVESGVSFQRLNEFLKEQNLRQLDFPFNLNSTMGGSLQFMPSLQAVTQKVKVFSEGEVFDIDILDLKESDFILSVILKVKSGDS